MDFYKRLCTGHLGVVLEMLEYLKHETNVWFEITTLLIPGHNDSTQEVRKLSEWVIDRLGPDVPLHFTAFHPDYKMLEVPLTSARTLTLARDIARETGLHYVYTGNVHDERGGSTYCPCCGTRVISVSLRHPATLLERRGGRRQREGEPDHILLLDCKPTSAAPLFRHLLPRVGEPTMTSIGLLLMLDCQVDELRQDRH